MAPVLSGLQIEVGDVYTETWNVFKAHLKPAATLTGIMFGLGWLVPGLIIGGGAMASNFDTREVTPLLAAVAIGILMMIIVMFVGSSALYALYLDALRGRPVDLGAAVSRGASKIPMLFLTSICLVVAILVGYVMCCVPGLLVALGTVLWPGVIFEENLGPIDTLQRAWDLADGHKVNIFLNYLVLMFVNMGIGIVALLIGSIIVGILGIDNSQLLGPGTPPGFVAQMAGQAIQVVLSVLVAPFQAALICVMYDRRTRNPAMPGMQVAQVFS